MKNIIDFYKSKTTELFYLELNKDIYNIEFPLPILRKDLKNQLNLIIFSEE